jgi:hypothetical protein
VYNTLLFFYLFICNFMVCSFKLTFIPSDMNRVTSWVCEKFPQNVAPPIFDLN